MKSVKEIKSMLFDFADNMIKMKSKSLESGNLSEEEVAEVQADIDQFNKIKSDFFTNEFSASEYPQKYLECFMALRSLISAYGVDGLVDIPESVTPLVELIQSHLESINSGSDMIPEYKDLLIKCKDAELMPMQFSSLQEGVEYLKDKCMNEVHFADGGKSCIESALNFIRQIAIRMKNAENPDTDAIAQYDQAIAEIEEYLNSDVKEFSSKFMKKFSAEMSKNPEFSDVVDDLSEEGYGVFKIDEYPEDDRMVSIWKFTTDEYETEIRVESTPEESHFYDEDQEIQVEDLKKYIKDQLEDININLK